MNNELLSVLDSLEREKGIPKEILFEAIESALVSAATKMLNKEKEEITVQIDRKSGQTNVMCDGKPVDSIEFGRIAAQTAKQVIIQKIREAERNIVFDEYTLKVGSITAGGVHRFEKGNIIVDLGKTEAVLPKSEQVYREKYRQGDRIRAYVLEVNKTTHGPSIILSRKSPDFVRNLFELEVPEIVDGIVEIKGIVREPGELTKIAVFSKDRKIDPVGSCVGMRGQRVKDIVRELHGERIDVVQWSDDVETYLKQALKQIDTVSIKLDQKSKIINCIVKDDSLSAAIGKHGQNVRLISKLLGWNLQIRGESEPNVNNKPKAVLEAEKAAAADAAPADAVSIDAAPAEVVESVAPESDDAGTESAISEVKGVGKSSEKVLTEAGYGSLEKLANASVEDLVKLDGIGKKGAESMINSARELLNKKDA